MVTIQQIFVGNVSHWQDPSIVATNPGNNSGLPNEAIQRVVFAVTDDASKVLRSSLAMDTGASAAWPTVNTTVVTSEANMIDAIHNTPYAIGFVATHLLVQTELNHVHVVATSLFSSSTGCSITAYTGSSCDSAKTTNADETSIAHNTLRGSTLLNLVPASRAWPFSKTVGMSVLINAAAVRASCALRFESYLFLHWLFASVAAQNAIKASGAAPLPHNIKAENIKQLQDSMSCGGELISTMVCVYMQRHCNDQFFA